MDEEWCFVCTQKIIGKTYFSSQSQENSNMLCQILKIPHLGINDNNTNKSRFSFEKINYCFSCVDRIRTVRDMLTELESLEKQILDESTSIQLQLKVVYDNYDSKLEGNLNIEKNNSSLQFRAAIMNELRSIQTAEMRGNTQNNKNIRQKFISGRRDKIIENKNSLSLSSNINPTQIVGIIGQPVNKNEDSHNKCVVDCFVNGPVIKLEVEVTESLSCQSPYPTDNSFDDEEDLLEDWTTTVNSSTQNNNIEDTTVGDRLVSISKTVDVPKEIKRKVNSSKVEKASRYGSSKTPTQTPQSYIPEELHNSFPRTLRPRKSIKSYEKSMTLKNDVKIPKLVHNKSRKVENSTSYMCQHCDRTFKTSGHAKSHERLKHTGEKPYTCKYCEKTFGSRREFRYHKITHTAEEKGFKCKNCELICKNRSDLKRHERIVHKIADKKFMCGHCGKTFLDTPSLRSHERIHTGEKPYMCQFCPQIFANKTAVTSHELTHTGEKPFKCSYCEKTFRHLHNRKKHERAAHTGVTPYICKYCQKPFTNGSNAKRHELTHTQERTHECRCCGKKFATTTDVKTHMRTHPGEKPYKCQYCELQFSYWNNIKDHVNFIHAADIALTSGKTTFCS